MLIQSSVWLLSKKNRSNINKETKVASNMLQNKQNMDPNAETGGTRTSEL